MFARRVLAGLVGALLLAAAAPADDPATNVRVSVDGVNVDGILGYRIEFNRQSLLRTDARRLGVAYSPDTRNLQLTVTQKGLNRLQDWINSVGNGGTPPTKTVVLTALDAKDQVLVRWQLNGVMPTTLNHAAAGQFVDVTATLEFFFDGMQLLEASGQ